MFLHFMGSVRKEMKIELTAKNFEETFTASKSHSQLRQHQSKKINVCRTMLYRVART